jgi:Transposase IS66 family
MTVSFDRYVQTPDGKRVARPAEIVNVVAMLKGDEPGGRTYLVCSRYDSRNSSNDDSVKEALEVAADKYITHIPLEREVRKMAGEGLEVTSQTLWDEVHALVRALTPPWEALRANIVSQAVAAFDETRWEVVTEERGQEELDDVAALHVAGRLLHHRARR